MAKPRVKATEALEKLSAAIPLCSSRLSDDEPKPEVNVVTR